MSAVQRLVRRATPPPAPVPSPLTRLPVRRIAATGAAAAAGMVAVSAASAATSALRRRVEGR